MSVIIILSRRRSAIPEKIISAAGLQYSSLPPIINHLAYLYSIIAFLAVKNSGLCTRQGYIFCSLAYCSGGAVTFDIIGIGRLMLTSKRFFSVSSRILVSQVPFSLLGLGTQIKIASQKVLIINGSIKRRTVQRNLIYQLLNLKIFHY